MSFREFATYSFAPNVGRTDRIFRIVSGLLLAGVPWAVHGLSIWLWVILTVAGLAWALTGAVSRCSIYYLLGFTTRR